MVDNELVRRIMLQVAYDGSDYHGWQIQPDTENVPTIEGELNKALSSLLKADIQVIGASRTDAGVHAEGNIAVFDTSSRIPADRFPYPLNELLPESIRVVESKEVPVTFHPRKCDTKKTYEYHILNTKFDVPTKSRYTHHVYGNLDIEKMQEAASYLIGEHDFTSFCSVNSQSESKVRTIYNLDLTKYENEIIITVTGSGFLYNMVRIIAGTLIEVGRGKYAAIDVKNILEARDRTKAGPTAPAKGLLLKNYEFL